MLGKKFKNIFICSFYYFEFCCSLYKRDERCIFLYVKQNCDDFQIYLPSAQCRERFYDLILQMTEGIIQAPLDSDLSTDQIKVITILQ